LKCNLFWSWYCWNVAVLAFNNNHSLTQSQRVSMQVGSSRAQPSLKQTNCYVVIHMFLFVGNHWMLSQQYKHYTLDAIWKYIKPLFLRTRTN